MNVVIAALSAPEQLNGVSRHAANLARALLTAPQVECVHFIAGDWQQQMFRAALPERNARLHMHWIRLRDANLGRLLWYHHELPQIATQLEAEIVHFTYPAPLPTHGYPCPVILSLHDLYPFDTPVNFGTLRSAAARHTMRQCIQRAESLACVSTCTRTQLERWFPDRASRAVVIPNVVELRASPCAERPLEPLRGHSFLLSVAQHRRNKNVPLSIQAFSRALQQRVLPCDARFVIVGIPGPETSAIHACIREHRLEGRVLLYSGLTDPELQWCYRNSLLLLAPSSIEGFGLPVAEAALAGSRIICSDIPAFHEVAAPGIHFVRQQSDMAAAYVRAMVASLALPKPAPASLPHLSACFIGQRFAELYRTLVCSRIAGFDMLAQPESAR